MALTIPFSGLKVLLEVTPGVYAVPCGLIQRTIVFTKDVAETVGIDCDDEDAPAWLERDVISLSASISGEGVLARESLRLWRQTFESGTPTNTRIQISGTAAQGGGYWSGQFFLTSFEPGATRSERAAVSIEMLSSGPVAWTPEGDIVVPPPTDDPLIISGDPMIVVGSPLIV
jgi:hypothetical protein